MFSDKIACSLDVACNRLGVLANLVLPQQLCTDDTEERSTLRQRAHMHHGMAQQRSRVAGISLRSDRIPHQQGLRYSIGHGRCVDQRSLGIVDTNLSARNDIPRLIPLRIFDECSNRSIGSGQQLASSGAITRERLHPGKTRPGNRLAIAFVGCLFERFHRICKQLARLLRTTLNGNRRDPALHERSVDGVFDLVAGRNGCRQVVSRCQLGSDSFIGLRTARAWSTRSRCESTLQSAVTHLGGSDIRSGNATIVVVIDLTQRLPGRGQIAPGRLHCHDLTQHFPRRPVVLDLRCARYRCFNVPAAQLCRRNRRLRSTQRAFRSDRLSREAGTGQIIRGDLHQHDFMQRPSLKRWLGNVPRDFQRCTRRALSRDLIANQRLRSGNAGLNPGLPIGIANLDGLCRCELECRLSPRRGIHGVSPIGGCAETAAEGSYPHDGDAGAPDHETLSQAS